MQDTVSYLRVETAQGQDVLTLTQTPHGSNLSLSREMAMKKRPSAWRLSSRPQAPCRRAG
jgi:hypothetical protein